MYDGDYFVVFSRFEAKGGQVVRRKIGALSEVQYTFCSRFESC